jgi:hypothetical protein
MWEAFDARISADPAAERAELVDLFWLPTGTGPMQLHGRGSQT